MNRGAVRADELRPEPDTPSRVRRLRVLYLVPDLRVGGAERHVTTLMPGLDPDRFEPSVLCIGREGELFGALTEAGVPALALGRTKRQAIATLRELVGQLRRIRPDVVIVRGYNAEGLGRIAARIAGVPHTVVWVHNCGDAEPRGRIRRLTDRVLDRVTSAYFGVAQAQIDYLIDDLGYSPDKVHIIHNGIDPTGFAPSDDRNAVRALGIGTEPVVGILAALRPEKDHLGLLQAARIVVDARPEVKFLFVGDGPMRSELERETVALGLESNIVFTGSRSDVPEVLRALDVFVLASYSVECFPMALLEAMAAGRPAVCTAVGGVPELLADGVTGHLVPPRDPQALAAAITAILADPVAAQRMGSAARERVEAGFTLTRAITETEQALLDLAGPAEQDPIDPVRLDVVLDLTFVGGVEVLLLRLFREFEPSRVRPRILCLRESGPLAAEFEAAGFEVVVLDRAGRFDLSTLPKLVAEYRRNHTDVVLVPHHHRAALLLGRVAARLAGVHANIVAAHDMDLTAVGGRVLPKWAVATLRLSDTLVLLTPRQGEYLRREEGVGRGLSRGIDEVVIPNGIALPPVPGPAERDAARAELGLAAEDFVIGIVARLSPQKAHEVLLSAFVRVLAELPSARLVVIGDGGRRDDLEALAAELGVAEHTIFTGIRDDVAALLPGFDVACLSSVHEGVPIVVIEAMAAALPVVATDCGSLRDMVDSGEQGYLVPVGDSNALAHRLIHIGGDESHRRQLGKNGRARVEREFDIAHTARAYERLLTKLGEQS
ncbi:glycosyltransferase [Aldersonia kunmingensis]|uniref:glycosyltransferase n=1 Tax=Aldersonia kunmingensis TaxID=408066 RepID=UPI000A7B3C2D|nr:glycosyltransferase [Aldersonia kunmingensis]